MSTRIEIKAKKYLLRKFKNRFFPKMTNEKGFDLWMINGIRKIRIELKATEMEYKIKSQIFSQLYFSSKEEVEFFKSGKTKIFRIFMGKRPYKMFLIDNKILKEGVRFKTDFRKKIVGKKDYTSKSISNFP